MSAETDLSTETVYVFLLGEGTTVSRPTQAIVLGGGKYKLLATSGYDPEDEIWEFLPGSVVSCELEILDGHKVHVARQRVEEK